MKYFDVKLCVPCYDQNFELIIAQNICIRFLNELAFECFRSYTFEQLIPFLYKYINNKQIITSYYCIADVETDSYLGENEEEIDIDLSDYESSSKK